MVVENVACYLTVSQAKGSNVWHSFHCTMPRELKRLQVKA